MNNNFVVVRLSSSQSCVSC